MGGGAPHRDRGPRSRPRWIATLTTCGRLRCRGWARSSPSQDHVGRRGEGRRPAPVPERALPGRVAQFRSGIPHRRDRVRDRRERVRDCRDRARDCRDRVRDCRDQGRGTPPGTHPRPPGTDHPPPGTDHPPPGTQNRSPGTRKWPPGTRRWSPGTNSHPVPHRAPGFGGEGRRLPSEEEMPVAPGLRIHDPGRALQRAPHRPGFAALRARPPPRPRRDRNRA